MTDVINHKGNISIIASRDTWMEGEAVRQLEATASLPGMLRCVGMPDLHPGKGSPVGAAFVAKLLYAHLVGSDIGCGMALFSTDIKANKAKPAKMAAHLDGLDHPWDGDVAAWLHDHNVVSTAYDASLGTPGHSNHFIEIQRVLDIARPEDAATIGLNAENLCILVHSGSRGYGESILYEVAQKSGASGLACDDADGLQYRQAHDHAVQWAVANRALCAHRTLELLNANGQRLLDICHNSVQPYVTDGCACWLHRKGAAPTDLGPIVIPGSRGDVSYVVQPHPNPISLNSVAHGAGRKIARGEAKGKLDHRYKVTDLQKNKWGGQVICGERQLLWEEAPDCYKDIHSVVNDLVDAGLVEVIATLAPLVTFKTSEGARTETKHNKEAWQRDRRAARAAKHHR